MRDTRANDNRSIAAKIIHLTAAMTIGLIVMIASPLDANIYSWRDANGVKHYSNVPPPPDKNRVVNVNREILYDKDADEERWDLDQKDWEALKEDLQEAERQKIEESYGSQNNQAAIGLAEKIQQEKFRLELEISRLEKQPAGSFARNLDGKRAAIAFYQSRLKELESDPQRYFNIP